MITVNKDQGIGWDETIEALYEDHPEMFTMKKDDISIIEEDLDKELDYIMAEIYQKEWLEAHPTTFTSLGLKRRSK